MTDLAACKRLTDLRDGLDAWAAQRPENRMAALPAMAALSADLDAVHHRLIQDSRAARMGDEPPCMIGGFGE